MSAKHFAQPNDARRDGARASQPPASRQAPDSRELDPAASSNPYAQASGRADVAGGAYMQNPSDHYADASYYSARRQGKRPSRRPSPSMVGARPERPAKKRARWPYAVAAVIVVAILGVVGYLYMNPPYYDVSVNGTTLSVRNGSTIQDVIDNGYAKPKAGNLIAVDGSVAQQGGGTAFTAKVNGQDVADASMTLRRNDTLELTDGQDVTEDYTETTQVIERSTSGGVDVSSPASYYVGPIHVYSEGEDGEQTVRTGSVSGKVVTEVTKQPVAAGYHAYTANVGDDKVIALTFDDGPTAAYTPEVLDILKENGAKATFFQIGEQIAENASIEKRIYDEGHQLATHTWDHAKGSGGGVDLTKMSASEQVEEVERGFAAIEDTLGVKVSRIMRAPGGNYYGSLVSNLRDKVDAEIGWNVDTEDWKNTQDGGSAAIAQAILSVKPGQVVLMHDGGGNRSQTVAALREALPQLVAQGYKFVTIDELMAYGMPS